VSNFGGGSERTCLIVSACFFISDETIVLDYTNHPDLMLAFRSSYLPPLEVEFCLRIDLDKADLNELSLFILCVSC
jgi:hypothetical protein